MPMCYCLDYFISKTTKNSNDDNYFSALNIYRCFIIYVINVGNECFWSKHNYSFVVALKRDNQKLI